MRRHLVQRAGPVLFRPRHLAAGAPTRRRRHCAAGCCCYCWGALGACSRLSGLASGDQGRLEQAGPAGVAAGLSFAGSAERRRALGAARCQEWVIKSSLDCARCPIKGEVDAGQMQRPRWQSSAFALPPRPATLWAINLFSGTRIRGLHILKSIACSHELALRGSGQGVCMCASAEATDGGAMQHALISGALPASLVVAAAAAAARVPHSSCLSQHTGGRAAGGAQGGHPARQRPQKPGRRHRSGACSACSARRRGAQAGQEGGQEGRRRSSACGGRGRRVQQGTPGGACVPSCGQHELSPLCCSSSCRSCARHLPLSPAHLPAAHASRPSSPTPLPRSAA